jgi:hypothetical protein
MGVYPFMFGAIKDFEPVAQEIIKVRPENVTYHELGLTPRRKI